MSFYKWFYLIESLHLQDDRQNKSATRFIAATIKSILYLLDIKDENATYHSLYDILVIVDTDKKIISYPKHHIGSYRYNDIDEVYNAKNHYIKKIYNELKKFSVIDGEYKLKNYQSSYVTDINKLSLSDDVVLYHGTTEKALDGIKKFGLRPQDTSTLNYSIRSKNRGNGSTIPNHTEYNIYLTPNKTLAIQYAKSQAKFRNDIPVLLSISIPDYSKLMSDDDYIRDNINKFILKMFVYETKYSDKEQEYIDDLIGTDVLYEILGGDVEEYIYSSDESLLSLGKRFVDSVLEEYRRLCSLHPNKSMLSSWNSVAYRGRIPSKFISIKTLQPLTEQKSPFKKWLDILEK